MPFCPDFWSPFPDSFCRGYSMPHSFLSTPPRLPPPSAFFPDLLSINPPHFLLAKCLILFLQRVLGGEEKVPIFFYVHGGSYYMGSGRLYPGQILAASQNIIVVTFNFRLGPIGKCFPFSSSHASDQDQTKTLRSLRLGSDLVPIPGRTPVCPAPSLLRPTTSR